MNERTIKFSYDEIDLLIEAMDKDVWKDIKWKHVTEEEIDKLLKTS
ncbi:hypothetical protein [Bacillus sinesaloumensis]|nr:hypothetical protein [Bacillus sinesaloumensis]